MREVDVSTITRAVEMMCIEANMVLTDDIVGRIKSSIDEERSPLARSILEAYLENMQAAKDMKIPVCQDTGMAVIFLELGQEVHLVGGSLREAVDRGVSNGYTNGYLRCSVVGDPLWERVNTRSEVSTICFFSACRVLNVWKNSSCVLSLPPMNWMSSMSSTSAKRYLLRNSTTVELRMDSMSSFVKTSPRR